MILPETGFLREKQIIGDKTANIPPIIPVSRSAWLLGIESGIYPKSYKLSPKIKVWRVEDIRQLIQDIESQNV